MEVTYGPNIFIVDHSWTQEPYEDQSFHAREI